MSDPNPPGIAQGAGEPEMELIRRIFPLLCRATGVDFSQYKESTIKRRVSRRMAIHGLSSTGKYVEFLLGDPDEALRLFKELLIGVTQFFRDPLAFQSLCRDVLPRLFVDNGGEIRAWVCGCSTGEEAYSLAMAMREFMDKSGRDREVRIFATDIDRHALEFAAEGVYHDDEADLFFRESGGDCFSRNAREKYFTRQGSGHRVVRPIRDMVIFSRHNVLRDPPFSDLDLVACRNLLIYLKPAMQQRVLGLLHSSLRPKGWLFLGSSESVGPSASLFSLFDAKWKIYREGGESVPQPMVTAVRGNGAVDLSGRAMPPSIIVRPDHRLVQFFGDIGPYLEPLEGSRAGLKSGADVRVLMRGDLAGPLEAALEKAFEENEETFTNAPLEPGDQENGPGTGRVGLVITPFEDAAAGQRLALVVFEGAAGDGPGEGKERGPEKGPGEQKAEAGKIGRELLAAREENKKLVRELGSLREELKVVGDAHRDRIRELGELADDMDNLIAASGLCAVYLDQGLCLRGFTPRAGKRLGLAESHLGRPASHVSFGIDYEGLVEDARSVLRGKAPLRKEVEDGGGNLVRVGLTPYVTARGRVEGVVLYFPDVIEGSGESPETD